MTRLALAAALLLAGGAAQAQGYAAPDNAAGAYGRPRAQATQGVNPYEHWTTRLDRTDTDGPPARPLNPYTVPPPDPARNRW